MADQNISEVVKSLIQMEVVKALNNSAPEAIEKLVKAALEKPVDASGNFAGYGDKMPYLDYIVGSEIRAAAANAVRLVIKEHSTAIESHVRAGLQSDTVVAAITNAIVGAADQEWRINVKFEGEKSR